MILDRLHIQSFRSYKEQLFDCHPKLNLVTGLNGSGKTNFLDAIHCLAFCKSRLSATDGPNIHHGDTFFRIEGSFLAGDRKEKIALVYGKKRKKEISVNGSKVESFSSHIGRLPLLMITPDDRVLIKGHSEERRRLIDVGLSQSDREYLEQLIRYNRIVKQRNQLLKSIPYGSKAPADLLDTYDSQLLAPADHINQKRKELCENLQTDFQAYYQQISGDREQVSLSYRSALNEYSYSDLLKESREKDCVLQRTTTGIHRDDVIFGMGDHKIKQIGSQGQQKTYLLAMKLSMLSLLKTRIGTAPILLLDDVFDKLDPQRVQSLLDLVTNEQFGQVFLTDTQSERLVEATERLNLEHKLFTIKDSKCNE